MKYILIERLHRYVFDKIFDQKHRITIGDKLTLLVYSMVTKVNHDWRYNLHCVAKPYNRYSKISRL